MHVSSSAKKKGAGGQDAQEKEKKKAALNAFFSPGGVLQGLVCSGFSSEARTANYRREHINERRRREHAKSILGGADSK
jgi:hypothetical protein